MRVGAAEQEPRRRSRTLSRLEDEVVGEDRCDAVQRQRELRVAEIGVDVGLHLIGGGVEAQHADRTGMQRVEVSEGVGADECERLVAAVRQVGVDCMQVDLVGFGMMEVVDAVMRGACGAECGRPVDESVMAEAPPEGLPCLTGEQDVVADIALDVAGDGAAAEAVVRVVAGAEDNVAGDRAAVDDDVVLVGRFAPDVAEHAPLLVSRIAPAVCV